jgi:hypothetical protein
LKESDGSDTKCCVCGSGVARSDDPLLRFWGVNLMEIKLDPYGKINFHVSCLLRQFQKHLKDVGSRLEAAVAALEERTKAQQALERILTELEMKGNISLTKDIVLYSSSRTVYLKVTDYQKGYWAQVPLDRVTLRALLNFFKVLAQSGMEKASSEG